MWNFTESLDIYELKTNKDPLVIPNYHRDNVHVPHCNLTTNTITSIIIQRDSFEKNPRISKLSFSGRLTYILLRHSFGTDIQIKFQHPVYVLI